MADKKTDAEKRAAKGKATKARNKKASVAQDKKLRKAQAEARNAKAKLKQHIETWDKAKEFFKSRD